MSGHTAGKWEMQRLHSHNEAIVGIWAIPGGECIAVCKSGIADNEANAVFIVRACNSHEELLAALKELASWDLHSQCFDGTRAKNAAESLANVRRFAHNALLTAEGRE